MRHNIPDTLSVQVFVSYCSPTCHCYCYCFFHLPVFKQAETLWAEMKTNDNFQSLNFPNLPTESHGQRETIVFQKPCLPSSICFSFAWVRSPWASLLANLLHQWAVQWKLSSRRAVLSPQCPLWIEEGRRFREESRAVNDVGHWHKPQSVVNNVHDAVRSVCFIKAFY